MVGKLRQGRGAAVQAVCRSAVLLPGVARIIFTCSVCSRMALGSYVAPLA